MPRVSRNQWDFNFGDTTPRSGPPPSRAISVSDLTRKIRSLLEAGLPSITVNGEVSGFRLQPSGHAYFVLKDEAAQLQCVLFKSQQVHGRNHLRDGARVVIEGELTVYEARGQYQLLVRGVEPDGLGALQAAFERLKQRLKLEGLFDDARKRRLPPYPRTIGIVSSPTGAALRDVLHVLERRHPGLHVLLAASRVQGEGAAAELARGIALLNRIPAALDIPVDIILLTRGGGSLEDLWAFNDESLARAIRTSSIPVVSAVGHEVDFTIADFVADLRAATPSAAAEILTEPWVRLRETLPVIRHRFVRSSRAALNHLGESLLRARSSLHAYRPRRVLQFRLQAVDDLVARLGPAARSGLARNFLKLTRASGTLRSHSPAARLAMLQPRLALALTSARAFTHTGLREKRSRLDQAAARLAALSPAAVLARGFSITHRESDALVLKSGSSVHPGDVLVTVLAHGTVRSRVMASEPEGQGTPSPR